MYAGFGRLCECQGISGGRASDAHRRRWRRGRGGRKFLLLIPTTLALEGKGPFTTGGGGGGGAERTLNSYVSLPPSPNNGSRRRGWKFLTSTTTTTPQLQFQPASLFQKPFSFSVHLGREMCVRREISASLIKCENALFLSHGLGFFALCARAMAQCFFRRASSHSRRS